MRRFLLIISALITTLQLSAQESSSMSNTAAKEGLSSFTAIDVDAPIKLTLINIAQSEVPYIEYDTKGVYTSKFSAEVDNNGTLKIRERYDSKRESITEVKVYYNTLEDICIDKADVMVVGTLDSPLLDISISSNANFISDIDTKDLMINISGRCRVVITGKALYQTANVATAEYDASKLSTMATTISGSHNAVIKVDAYQRLEASTATGAIISSKSIPEILRQEVTLFGGEIKQL